MTIKEVLVPDIGNFDSVDVIEVLVKPGDTIAKDDSLVTLESDKASMDIPAPFAGTVTEVKIKVGEQAKQGEGAKKKGREVAEPAVAQVHGHRSRSPLQVENGRPLDLTTEARPW